MHPVTGRTTHDHAFAIVSHSWPPAAPLPDGAATVPGTCHGPWKGANERSPRVLRQLPQPPTKKSLPDLEGPESCDRRPAVVPGCTVLPGPARSEFSGPDREAQTEAGHHHGADQSMPVGRARYGSGATRPVQGSWPLEKATDQTALRCRSVAAGYTRARKFPGPDLEQARGRGPAGLAPGSACVRNAEPVRRRRCGLRDEPA